jgi:nucleoside-diphosphate-sugar epimerase
MIIYYYGGSGFIGKNNLNMLDSNRIQFKEINRDLSNLSNLKKPPNNSDKKILIIANGCSLQYRQSYGIEKEFLNSEIEQHKNIYKRMIENLNPDFVSNMIFFSSGGALYDRNDKNKKNELAEINPCSSYGLLKFELEKYLQLIASELSIPLTILRISNVYGPGQVANRGQGLIPTIITSIMNNKDIHVIPNSVRDYLHISDFNNMLLGVLKDINKFTGIFNLGSGIGYSSMEIAQTISKVLKLQGYQFDFDKLVVFSEMKQEIDCSILDCSKYYRISEISPAISLVNGIDGILKAVK